MGRALLVTGGGRGIGRAVATSAAARGWAVAINYAGREDAAQETLAAIEAAGGRGMIVRADVADEAAVEAMFRAVDDKLGPLGGLVNNAGIVDRRCEVADMSAARLRRMFDVNVVGAFLCAREAARRMSTARGGAGGIIVNVSSAAARLGGGGQYVDYAASKGAIDTMTRGLAQELAQQGVRVAAVRPGIIETDIHASGGEPDRVGKMIPLVPMRRAGTAEEVAAAIVWLLSDEASYVTGAILDVSGGR